MIQNMLMGILLYSDDRRFIMGSGPFTMAPGDSQEVVYGSLHAADPEVH